MRILRNTADQTATNDEVENIAVESAVLKRRIDDWESP